MSATTMHASQDAHIKALRHKHATLSQKVDEARNHHSTSDYYLSQLKKEKLLLKEQIEGIRA